MLKMMKCLIPDILAEAEKCSSCKIVELEMPSLKSDVAGEAVYEAEMGLCWPRHLHAPTTLF